MYRFMRREQLGTSDPDPEPHQQYEVHCGRCNWWGMVGQMRLIHKPNPSKPGDVIPELGCPMCLSDQWLEYEDRSHLEQMVFAFYLAKLELKISMDNLRIAIG